MTLVHPFATLAPTNTIEILLVEDNEQDAILMRHQLESGPRPIHVTHCARLADTLAHLESEPCDVILLDLNLPDATGLELVRDVLNAAPTTPVIVVTALDDDEAALDAVKLGAQDYLTKAETATRALHKTLFHAIERQRLQTEIREARIVDAEMKDRFLSHVSHELRTPLTAISQFVSLMLDGLAGDLSEKQDEYLQIVDRNVDHLARLIRDLMDVTRLEAGKLELQLDVIDAADLARKVSASMRETASAKKVDLEVCVGTELPRVVADDARITQVIVNLLGNAIKFTPEGGRVTVSVDGDTPGAVRISVADNGCGMSDETLAHVFDRLYQADRPTVDSARHGLGLGLYITSEIIELHGGKITASSIEGQGSVFEFTLPTYDLENLVRHVVGSKSDLHPITALLVTLDPTAPHITESKIAAAVGRVRRLLAECVVGAMDIVVPGHRRHGKESQLVVLLRADAENAGVVANRIRLHLEEQRPAGFDCTLAQATLDAEQATGDGSTATKTLTRQLEALLLEDSA